MKIRHPLLLKMTGAAGSWLLRGLVKSVRTQYWAEGPSVMPPPEEPAPRYLFVLWHEYMIVPTIHFARPTVASLISAHADGQLLASLMRNLNMGVIHGSTNRGGVQAVREVIRDVSGFRHLAITPDGPRGPRRVVQPGAVYLAAKTGLQLAPLGIAYDSPWRLKSWDRFAIPKPTFKVQVVSGQPLVLPKSLRSDSLAEYQGWLQHELDRLTQVAEAKLFGQQPPVEATSLY